MNNYEYVEYLLKNYNNLKSEIEMLKFELECFKGINEVETIETLSFQKNDGDKVQTSSISDNTSKVALVYRQAMNRINYVSKNDIKIQIMMNEYEIMKLEHGLKSLREPVKSIIEDIYIQGLSWDKVLNKYFISETTLCRYRKKAIKKLAMLF